VRDNVPTPGGASDIILVTDKMDNAATTKRLEEIHYTESRTLREEGEPTHASNTLVFNVNMRVQCQHAFRVGRGQTPRSYAAGLGAILGAN
jgi:hypothetical protein